MCLGTSEAAARRPAWAACWPALSDTTSPSWKVGIVHNACWNCAVQCGSLPAGGNIPCVNCRSVLVAAGLTQVACPPFQPTTVPALPCGAGLDILSSPSGPILAAQQLAAAAWGADATWFLVNGTTAGIHAAVMATCGPGDALLLARNAHLSAFNAMVLAGCTPVYAQPCCDAHLGIAHHVAPAALEAAFEAAARQELRVGAALVVSPTYFGVLSDIAGGHGA